MPDLIFPFDKVPEQIRDWLTSDTVDGIIEELFKRYSTFTNDQQKSIPLIITWLPLRRIKANQTISTLINRFKIDLAAAEDIAKTLEHRVFEPVKTGMLETYGIVVADMLQKPGIAARTMAIETPTNKPVVAPKPQASRPPAAPVPPPLKARITEMGQMIDLRRPVLRSSSYAGQAPAAANAAGKSTVPVPAAQTMKIEGDFSAGGPKQPAPTEAKSASSSSAPKKPEGEHDTLETKKEFGLAEAIPKPPQPQEIEKYEDHHPAVEK